MAITNFCLLIMTTSPISAGIVIKHKLPACPTLPHSRCTNGSCTKFYFFFLKPRLIVLGCMCRCWESKLVIVPLCQGQILPPGLPFPFWPALESTFSLEKKRSKNLREAQLEPETQIGWCSLWSLLHRPGPRSQHCPSLCFHVEKIFLCLDNKFSFV